MAKKKKSLADELLEEPLVKSNTTKSDTKKVSVANTPKQRVTNTFEEIAPIRKTQNNLMSRDEVLSPLNIGKQKKIIQTAMNREKPEDNSTFFGTTANVLKTFGQGMMKAEESIFIDTPSALISKALLGGSRVTSRVASIFDDDLASKILIKGTQASNKLNEIAQDDWTANALDYYGWNKKLDNGKTVAETLESKSAITSNDILGKAVEGLGGMTPTILMGGLLGGSTAGVQTAQELEKVKKLQNVISYGSLGARSFGGAYEQALQSGATPDQAMAYGISSASVEIGTEWLSGGVPGVKGTVGGGLDEAFGKYVLKEGVEETSKSLSKAITKSLYKTSMEGVEEMISETLEPYIKQFTYEYDESKSLGENFNEASKKVSFQDIMEAGVVGSLTAVLLGDIDISDMKTGYQNTQAINNTIANEIQNQQNMLGRELTKEESNAIKTEIKDHANNVNQYGEEIANRIIDVKNNNTSTEGLDLEELLNQTPSDKSQVQFTLDQDEVKNIKSDKQKVLAEDMARLNNVKENHELFKTVNAIQGANSTQQYHITTTEGLYEMGIVNKDANGNYTMPDGSPYVPRGLNYKDGDIYINADVGNQSGTQAMYHEMFEGFKKASPNEYNEFKQMVTDIIGEEAIQKEYDTYKEMYGEELTDDIRDEIINDKFGEIAENQDFINRISDNRTLLQKFIDTVKDMINYVKGTEQEKELIKLQRNLEKQFAKRYKETDFSGNKGETAYSLEQNYRGSHQIENGKSITELDLDEIKNKITEIDGYLTNQSQSDLKKLQKILNNSDEKVKIYRAAPVNELNSGDWVTTDRSYAQNVANNNGGKVYTYEVNASELYYPDNVRELPSLHRLSSFQYNGENSNQTKYSLNKDSGIQTINDYINANNYTFNNNGVLTVSNLTDKQIKDLVKIYHTTGYEDVSTDYLVNRLKEGNMPLQREIADRFIEKELGYKPTIDTTQIFEDAEGNPLTKEQVEFYKDSAVRDIRGRLIPVYHRTNAEFTEFDSKAGTQHGKKYGKGFYFSTTPENYGNNTMKLYLNAKEGEFKYVPKMGYYIVQNPNQIKNVDNKAPTTNPDIRYSLTKDNTGRELSEGQRDYFKDSKAVDDDGNLVTVYHTMTNTGNQFNQFNPVGTDYYRFGDQVVNYYTDNQDMSGSYADQSYKKAYTKPINTIEDVQDFIDFQNTQSDSQIGVNGITNHYTIEKDGDGYIVKQKPSGKEYLSYINLSDEGKVALNRIKNNENLHNNFLGTEDYISTLKNQLEEWYNTRQYDGYPELAEVLDIYGRETTKLIAQEDTYGKQSILKSIFKNDLENYLFGTQQFPTEKINQVIDNNMATRFGSEKELINNIQNDFKAKYQYAGYINMTNPYIIDTFGENWDSVITERNQTKDEEYHRIVKDAETKEKLYQLAQESERLNKEYRHSGKDGELAQMSIIKNKIDNSELRETINDLGMFGFKYEEWLDAGRKNAELFGEQFETNLPSGNELITNYVSDLNPAEQQILQGMTINDFVNRYGELSVENNKYGTSSSYFQDQFYKTTGESLNTDIIGYTNMYNMAKYNFEGSMVDEILEERLTTNDLVKRIIEKNNSGETNYDGLIMKNVYDYGGQSNSSYRTTGDLYVTFNSNQFKAVDNLNPTEDADIRYSMTSNENIDSKEIAPIGSTQQETTQAIQEEIAPIREDLSNITEQMNNLSNQIETMQESLENTQQGYVETYNEQRNENIPTRNLTEEDANTLQDALMQDEGYLRSLDEQANQTTDNTKLVDKLTNEVNRRLDLDRGQKETLRNIINDSIEKGYSADELSYALYKEFSESSYEMTNQEAVDARRLIRDMPIKVSDAIKTDIADYGKWKQSNFGKINFSNSGSPVDSVYMELSEKMPYFFPSDIVNPTEQLLQIAEVANMATKTTETFDIDPDEFDNIADYIVNTQLEDEYNSQMNSQYDLEKNIQFDMNEDIAPTTIRTQDSIDDYIENRDIAPVKTDRTQQRQETMQNISKIKRILSEAFTNRNYVIDQEAKKTGNKYIRAVGDMYNNARGLGDYNVTTKQTDMYGNEVGKGLDEIFEPIEKAGLGRAFDDYLFNKSNIERHNVGKGTIVPVEVSRQLVTQYERENPSFKPASQEVYNFINNFSLMEVDSGILAKEKYDDFRGEFGIYGEYVPLVYDNIDKSRYIDDSGEAKSVSTFKRSKGGGGDINQLLPMKEAIANQSKSAFRAVWKNELLKQIIQSNEQFSEAMDMDTRTSITNLDDSLYVTPDGDYIASAYVDGEKISAKISEELYNELTGENEQRIAKLENDLSLITKPLQWLSNVRRKLVTNWSLTFPVRNAIKDASDAPVNSKHTKDWIKNYPTAYKELSQAKTKEAKQFLALYGSELYGDYSNKSNAGKMAQRILNTNELIELAPRFAEFKASLQNGETAIDAIYNAREVTTNFGRGGYITRALNRNGFTFLNVNVQGLSKLVRNLSGENGAKGVASVVVKGALFAVAPSIINHLLYGLDDDKDEEYEAIPDYIKDNYYLVKTEGNNFVRIPKGRINAVFGSLARRMIEAGEGEGFDFKEWGENAWNQIGVGDSSGIQTIFTPLRQAFGSKNGEAWYGGDIVPTRLQNKPAGEQTDAKIDAVSNFIGENLGISPYKINYVLDQYSGGIGDVLLPYITPETKNGAETFGEHLVAPIKDAFVVNSTDDNKYAGEFYDLKDKLEIQSNSEKATDDDKIKYKYMSEVSKKMGDLYKEKREVQADTTLGKKAKYEKVQVIQNEINSLAKEGLSTYQSANTTENYSEIGDTEYYKNAKNEWTKVNEDEQEFTAGLNTAEKDSYFKAKNKIYGITQKYSNKLKGLDKDDPSKPQIYADKKEDITKAIVNSGLDNQMKAMVYSKYYSNQDTMTNVVNAGYDVDTYITALNDIDQLRTKYSKKNGYTTEERKQKTIAYINSLNMEIPQKAMMIRNYYTSFRQYNNDIVNFVANLDLSYEDKKAILEDTGMTVKGNSVSWK